MYTLEAFSSNIKESRECHELFRATDIVRERFQFYFTFYSNKASLVSISYFFVKAFYEDFFFKAVT